jgi:hypothetical protein
MMNDEYCNLLKIKPKNTEGPLRQISRDMLVDERTKLPLRFS